VYLPLAEVKKPNSHQGALTISYEIICDICINSIHKYIYIFRSEFFFDIVCLMSCCVNVLYCLYKWKITKKKGNAGK
jgi:hypothetical protein